MYATTIESSLHSLIRTTHTWKLHSDACSLPTQCLNSPLGPMWKGSLYFNLMNIALLIVQDVQSFSYSLNRGNPFFIVCVIGITWEGVGSCCYSRKTSSSSRGSQFLITYIRWTPTGLSCTEQGMYNETKMEWKSVTAYRIIMSVAAPMQLYDTSDEWIGSL